MERRMNLKDIAELAGVSIATVSNVINGNHQKVSVETRKKIEKIIKENGYKPNAMARSLAKNESRIIGLVVPYIGPEEDFLENPYNAHMIAALEKYVRSRDYYLMLRCVGHCREVIPLLSSWNVDGAFFLGVMEKEVKEINSALDVPVVFIDTYAKEKDIVNVGLDDYRGGYLSARYLTGKGHSKIALVSPDYREPGVIQERYNGFTDAFREAGISFDDGDIYRTDTAYQDAVKIGQDIVFSGKGYTAVATMSDIVAYGVIEGLRQCGVSVPEDISVIGFDNLPESEYMSPKLTTIAQDFDDKAKAAAEAMFRMVGKNEKFAEDLRMPIKVVERQSVKSL
jgi:LacI family transcriptional regulator